MRRQRPELKLGDLDVGDWGFEGVGGELGAGFAPADHDAVDDVDDGGEDGLGGLRRFVSFGRAPVRA